MNTKPIDKSKKSNIKCEHCKYWCEWSYYGEFKEHYCMNLGSEHQGMKRNYWNRCKSFEWEKSEDKE